MSIFVFASFYLNDSAKLLQHERLRTMIVRVAPLTLGIYVLHPMYLDILDRYGLNGLFINPLLGIPLLTIVIFTLSLVTARVIGYLPGCGVLVK
jgi:surface polysaccharide O-acyltransferase-like enzyme